MAQFFLKLFGIRASRKPEIQHGTNHVLHFLLIIDAASILHFCFTGHKWPVGMNLFVIVAYLGQDVFF